MSVTFVTYLITFACYGWHLHGDPFGSIDPAHNVPGTPILEQTPPVKFCRTTYE